MRTGAVWSGIVIFVDSEGRAVYDDFVNLLKYIDKSARAGVGLVRVDDGATFVYTSLLTSDIEFIDGKAREQQKTQPASNDLRTLLQTLQKRQMSASCDPALHLYLVGNASSATRKLIESLRRQIDSSFKISYLCCCTPRTTEEDLFSYSDVFTIWAVANDIHFTYFYGDFMQETLREHNTENLTYTTALALFALLMTRIPPDKTLFQADETPEAPLYGTVSACLVSSPHEAIRQACAARVAQYFLEDWDAAIISIQNSAETLPTLPERALVWLALPEDWKSFVRTGPKQKTSDLLQQFVPAPIETDLKKKTRSDYQLRYQAFLKKTEKFLQTSIPPGRFISGQWLAALLQMPEKAHQVALKAWHVALEDFWRDVYQEYVRQLKQQILNLWQQSGPEKVIAFAGNIDQQLARIIQRLEQTEIVFTSMQQPLQSLNINTNTQGSGLSTISEEQPYKVLSTELRRWPGKLVPFMACLLMSILFSYTFWLSSNEFSVMHLVSPILGSIVCFIGVFMIYALYMLREHIMPLMQAKQKLVQHIQEPLLMQCLGASIEQRLQIARQLREELSCLNSSFLQATAQSLHKLANQTLEQPFLENTGERLFLCGNRRYWSDAEEATSDFLAPSGRARDLYQQIVRENNDLFKKCKNALQVLFLKGKQSKDIQLQAFQQTLFEEILTEIDGHIRSYDADSSDLVLRGERKPGRFMQKDFTLDEKPAFWHRVLEQALKLPSWPMQKQIDPENIFLCTNNSLKIRRIKDHWEQKHILDAARQLVEVETDSVQALPGELTSNWVLLAALYLQPLHFPEKNSQEGSEII